MGGASPAGRDGTTIRWVVDIDDALPSPIGCHGLGNAVLSAEGVTLEGTFCIGTGAHPVAGTVAEGGVGERRPIGAKSSNGCYGVLLIIQDISFPGLGAGVVTAVGDHLADDPQAQETATV